MTLAKSRHIITDEDIKRNHVLSEKKHHSGIVKNALIHHYNDGDGNTPAQDNKSSRDPQKNMPHQESAVHSSDNFVEQNTHLRASGHHVAKMNSQLDDIEKIINEMIRMLNKDAEAPAIISK